MITTKSSDNENDLISTLVITIVFIILGISGAIFLFQFGYAIIFLLPGIFVDFIAQVLLNTGGSESFLNLLSLFGTVIFWLLLPWILFFKTKNRYKPKIKSIWVPSRKAKLLSILALSSWSGGSVFGMSFKLVESSKSPIMGNFVLIFLPSIIFFISIISLDIIIYKTLKK